MSDLYLDDPEKYDWIQCELIDDITENTKMYSIKCSHNHDGYIYDLKAVGIYSFGVIVSVKDIEVCGAEKIFE